MYRERLPTRPNWQAKVEAASLPYHTADGEPYWWEEACYVFSADEIDQIETVTDTLHELCLIAVDSLIRRGDLDRLHIPSAYWPWIANSWGRRDPEFYGRFDLAFDGKSSPKMLEYNADTPTSLLEAAVIQWEWLTEAKPGNDQFN